MTTPHKLIPFHEPFITGNEISFINEVIESKKLSGGGKFTLKCQQFFEEKYGYEKCLLTSSCTSALEMCSLLLDLKEGDEVIVPSYTFVTTASAFKLRGARIIFADSSAQHPNIDADKIESLITPNTKAIVIVHYGGTACDMDKIMALKEKYSFTLIEDNAHGIDSFYKGKPLGSFGDLATLSFHDTKTIVAGEAGMLIINKKDWITRAEILWEKGTNRKAFWEGKVSEYEWVDLGSSFQASEITAAFLWGQLICFEEILSQQKKVWEYYLRFFGNTNLDFVTIKHHDYINQNGYLYFLTFTSKVVRDDVICFLATKGITAKFHYTPLNQSSYILSHQTSSECPNAERFANTLLRLPCYPSLNEEDCMYIANTISETLQQ